MWSLAEVIISRLWLGTTTLCIILRWKRKSIRRRFLPHNLGLLKILARIIIWRDKHCKVRTNKGNQCPLYRKYRSRQISTYSTISPTKTFQTKGQTWLSDQVTLPQQKNNPKIYFKPHRTMKTGSNLPSPLQEMWMLLLLPWESLKEEFLREI